MGFVKNAIELISSPSHSRTVGIILVLFILAIIPLTVLVAQKQQEIRQRAAGVCEDTSIQDCSIMGFDPSSGNNICVYYEGLKCKKNNIVYQCEKQ